MKKALVLVLLAAVGYLAYSNKDRWLSSWVTFTPGDRAFSVSFPTGPAIDVRPVAGLGTPDVHALRAIGDDGLSYECSYLADDRLAAKDPEELIALLSDPGRDMGWRVISQRKIDVQGYSAIEVEANGRNNSVYYQRAVVVRNRVYRLFVIATNGAPRNSPNVQKFLDSFRIKG
jgi:hypothetical protein